MVFSGTHFYPYSGAAGVCVPGSSTHHWQSSARVPICDPLHPKWCFNLFSVHSLQTVSRRAGQTHSVPAALPGGGASWQKCITHWHQTERQSFSASCSGRHWPFKTICNISIATVFWMLRIYSLSQNLGILWVYKINNMLYLYTTKNRRKRTFLIEFLYFYIEYIHFCL